jgi:hypothetical protein
MNADKNTSNDGNDSGAPREVDDTLDAGGLTKEEREALPYPYNCFGRVNWPLYKGPPPVFKLPVLKTDEPAEAQGGSAALTTVSPSPVLKTDEPAALSPPVNAVQEANQLQDAIWRSLESVSVPSPADSQEEREIREAIELSLQTKYPRHK